MRKIMLLCCGALLLPPMLSARFSGPETCGLIDAIAPVATVPNLFTLLVHDSRLLRSQELQCAITTYTTASERDSVLRGAAMALNGEWEPALSMLPHSDGADAMRRKIHVVLALRKKTDWAKVETELKAILASPGGTASSEDSVLLATAQYLSQYDPGAGSQAPLFGHFNGGFYHFIARAHKWDSKYPLGQVNRACRVLMELSALDPGNVVWLELLGDLMQYYPLPFQGRWFAALAYYKASVLNKETENGPFRLKAIYALESNRNNPVNYNEERFHKMELAFRKEFERGPRLTVLPDSLRLVLASSDSLANASFAFLPADTTRPLLRVIRTDNEVLAGREKPFNPNADLENPDLKKRVKSNVFFNFYAIGVILIVVGAVVFFVRQVRKIDRDYHGTRSGGNGHSSRK